MLTKNLLLINNFLSNISPFLSELFDKAETQNILIIRYKIKWKK